MLTCFIQLNCSEANVEVKNGYKGESINSVHDFLNGSKRKGAAMEMFVQHAEISDEANLVVFLRHCKTLCGPLRIVVLAEDSDFTEAVDLCLEKQ